MLYPEDYYEKALKEQKNMQRKWFKNTSMKATKKLIDQGCSKEEMLQKFRVIFNEEEQGGRFLLQEELTRAGFFVETSELNGKPVHIITVSRSK